MGGPTFQIIFPPFDIAAAYAGAADRLAAFIGQDVTAGLATQIRDLIVRRTRSGQGIDGTFADYRPATQAIKGVGPQPVTLTDTQKRLDKLIGKIEPPRDAIVIKFDDADPQKIFTFHQVGTPRMAARVWLGLTAEEELFVFSAMRRIMETQTVPDMEQATGLPRS